MKPRPITHVTPKSARRKDLWWRGAVIYQIYPRSFADANGDGIGDLPGITAHLDYVAKLGVDAIWISPFMKSPMRDYGYDVADYKDVDPIFGTLADFDALLAQAHSLGLKVLVDFVPSHTSDEHPWFQESRQDRTNPRADWYVWADPKPDGTPPNNWLAMFGGSAWEWEPRRSQYYLHNFLKEQPDLNFHNPEVVAALLDQAKFWLERGVDGFRLDAIDFGAHDPQLRNNPARRPRATVGGAAPGSPVAMQLQRWNKALPELVELFLKPLHALTERYRGKMLLGEISGDDALLRAAQYTTGGGLDIAYTFHLLSCAPLASEVRAVVEHLERVLDDGWACWSLSNHDVRRAVTRFGGPSASNGLRTLLPIVLTSLRGTICLYQGEELGLEEADLALSDLKDPFGIAFWPTFKGRDGCRTPMPWRHDIPHGGFSSGKPWLPVPGSHLERAVDLQEQQESSTLSRVREFLHWRKRQPALVTGDISFERTQDPVLSFVRTEGKQSLHCIFNFGDEAVTKRTRASAVDAGCPVGDFELRGRTVTLPPHGIAFLRLEDHG
ncbi:MAG: alpha-glucosidase [Geminicoccaceae bacterium]